MDLAALVAIGCAAVDGGKQHLSVRRQNARAARASRKSIEKPRMDKEQSLRRRGHAIKHNRTAATRRDEEFEVSGKREKINGERRLEEMDRSRPPTGYVPAGGGATQGHEPAPELQCDFLSERQERDLQRMVGLASRRRVLSIDS